MEYDSTKDTYMEVKEMMSDKQKQFIATLINRLNNLEARVEKLERPIKGQERVTKAKLQEKSKVDTERLKQEYNLEIDYSKR